MISSAVAWLRPRLAWSNTARAWRERLGLGLCVAGAVILWWLADRLTLGQQLLLWCLLLLVLAILLNRGWYTLFGPVLFYDLVRTKRRSRFALYRIYAYFVVVLLSVFFMAWYYRVTNDATRHRDNVEFCSRFFFTFMSLQFVAAALLTPAYTAGVITAEKERRTLEYLLATDLRNREIVLSRLASRLANLLLMVLTGLPVMSFVEFGGGVPPELLLVGFAATAVTMVSLASLGILCSVYAKKTRTAILYTYLIVAVYLLLSGLSRLLRNTWLGTITWTFGDSSFSAVDLLYWFTAGNPVMHFIDLASSVIVGGQLADKLLSRLHDYAIFHGIVSVICTVWAVARLRGVFLKQADNLAPRHMIRSSWLARPQVGSRPMLWKELWLEGGLRFRWFGRLLLGALVLASFLPLLPLYWSSTATVGMREANINVWARLMGSFVACLLLISVAVRAATTITSERERDTLDGLLTTPLDSTTILWSKWLGSVFSIRWGWLWLGTIWGLGARLGGLHLRALPLLLLAWTVYAGLLATIGIWFSLSCRLGQRALIWTLLTSGAIGVGFVIVPADFLFASGAYGTNKFGLWMTRLEMGLTPPMAFGRLLPFGSNKVLKFIPAKESWEAPMALLGLAIWASAAVTLWFVACKRFRKMTCRQAVRHPDGLPVQEVTQGKPVQQLVVP